MKDFYSHTTVIRGTRHVVLNLNISSKTSPDVFYYNLIIVYFKPRAEFGETVCTVKEIPFTNDFVLDTFLDSLKKSLLLFKKRINKMPLFINIPGMDSIIAKYRLEKNL